MMEYTNNGRNPILPWEICIPDGEAHVMPDGKVYLYGSLDTHPDGFCSGSYCVVSSTDLQSWQVYPTSFDKKQVLWDGRTTFTPHSYLDGVTCFDELPVHIRQQLPESARAIPVQQIIAKIRKSTQVCLPKEMPLFAPDAIYKDGKYYLYFCIADDSEGVAVADTPQGPFVDAKRLSAQGIDPAVFVDEDSQAYYYWGQIKANAAKLNPDMTSLDEGSIVKDVLTEAKHHFHEGSSLRKRNGIYYYVFADISRGKPTCLGYATSRSPLGPFTYRGVIIDNAACDPGNWNIHGSIEEVNSQWYVFYHRSCNNSKYLRKACVEPIFFDEDGLIKEVKMTSQGAGKPYAPGDTVPAYAACEVAGGAYIDKDGVLQFPKGGTATFRYCRGVTGWQPNGTGELTMKLAEEIEPGMFEIVTVAKTAATLQSFILL